MKRYSIDQGLVSSYGYFAQMHVTRMVEAEAGEWVSYEEARTQIDCLRSALVGLVGVDTKEQLLLMKGAVHELSAPEEVKAVSINAINTLLRYL